MLTVLITHVRVSVYSEIRKKKKMSIQNSRSLEYGNFWLVSARLSLDRHYLFTYFFFRIFSEQLKSFLNFNNIKEYLKKIKMWVFKHFLSIFRAVSEQFYSRSLEYGNFFLVSARLSLDRHYLFTYFFFQNIFRAVEIFFKL